MKFNSKFSQWYLTESVLDIPRDGLDPSVFTFPEDGAPILKSAIASQIMQDLVQINKAITILDYFIVGSILTPRYNDYSDIDVTIEVEEEVDDNKMEDLINILGTINGRLAVGTTHSINYHIVTGMFDEDNTEAIYDLANQKWKKEPSSTTFSVKNILNKFKNTFADVDLATAELRRDLIDFTQLKKLSKSDIKGLEIEIEKTLASIESNVEDIVTMYDNAKMLRKNAFKKALTPKEIREFGVKNNLPENILYKLLERYYYKEFAVRLKELLNDGIEENDVKDVKKTFQDFIKKVS